jgi:hypothetical protein
MWSGFRGFGFGGDLAFVRETPLLPPPRAARANAWQQSLIAAANALILNNV